MSTYSLTNDFNNYFHAFKAPPFKPALEDSFDTPSSIDVRALVESSSLSSESGVKITLTPLEDEVTINPTLPQTYITEPGSIIRKDITESLNSPLNQRITMAAVRSDTFIPEGDELNSLLDKASSRNIDVSGIAAVIGVGNDEVTSTIFKSRTELGEFNGSGMAVSESGEVVGYLVKKGVPSRREEKSEISLNITSDRGNKIFINVSVLDRYNKNSQPSNPNSHIGVARDLEIEFQSEKALNKAEKESINQVLESLNPLVNSFHENLSVNKGNLTSLTSIQDKSGSAIQSIGLKLSTYNDRHSLALTKEKREQAKITSEPVSDDFYRNQARKKSYAAISTGQYDQKTYKDLWADITSGSESSWHRDIVNDGNANFDQSSRALIASTFT